MAYLVYNTLIMFIAPSTILLQVSISSISQHGFGVQTSKTTIGTNFEIKDTYRPIHSKLSKKYKTSRFIDKIRKHNKNGDI
jgi:hypothetical protein